MLRTPRSSWPCLMSHKARAWQRSSLLASCSPLRSRPLFNWLLTTQCRQILLDLRFWHSKPHNACWCPSPRNCHWDFFVFLPVDVVLHPAGHHVACPLVHRLDGFDDLQRNFITLEGNCNDHPEQLGGGALLAVQVVAHQVHILLGQQQGHLPIKGQIGKGLIKATLVLTATRSSAKCCSS